MPTGRIEKKNKYKRDGGDRLVVLLNSVVNQPRGNKTVEQGGVNKQEHTSLRSWGKGFRGKKVDVRSKRNKRPPAGNSVIMPSVGGGGMGSTGDHNEKLAEGKGQSAETVPSWMRRRRKKKRTRKKQKAKGQIKWVREGS